MCSTGGCTRRRWSKNNRRPREGGGRWQLGAMPMAAPPSRGRRLFLFALRHRQPVLQHHRQLGQREEEGEGGDAPYLDRQPEVEAHPRSEEHTSELQSLMRTSYAVFCLKKTHNPPSQTRTSNDD